MDLTHRTPSGRPSPPVASPTCSCRPTRAWMASQHSRSRATTSARARAAGWGGRAPPPGEGLPRSDGLRSGHVERHAGLETLPVGLRLAVTIGVFDGVHRGPLAVPRALVHAARAARGAPVGGTL